MPDALPSVPCVLRAIALTVALLSVATPALPANDIYKYVDDEGVQHFTDQWQLVPEQYRSRIQEIDPSTGKPFKPGSARPAPAPSQGAPAPISARKEPPPPPPQQEPPVYAAWLEKFSASQLATALLGVAIIWGAMQVIRMSGSPLVKLMLKGVITVVLMGGAYALYMTSLNDRISSATNTSSPPRISEKDLLHNIKGATEKVGAALKEGATAPLEKVKDATVGGAIQARDSMNQSNIEKETVLNTIESGP